MDHSFLGNRKVLMSTTASNEKVRKHKYRGVIVVTLVINELSFVFENLHLALKGFCKPEEQHILSSQNM